MKIWTNKNTLSTGVINEFNDVTECLQPGLVRRRIETTGEWLWFQPGEWFATREEAVADAEVRRQARIKVLEQNLKRLKALELK